MSCDVHYGCVQYGGVRLPSNPLAVRVAQFVPGRKEFVLLLQGGAVAAFAIGDLYPRIIVQPDSSTPPVTDLIDVTDLDGDGSPEIIAIHRGTAAGVTNQPRTAPVLYVYKGDGRRTVMYALPLGTVVAPGAVKIYGATGTNEMRIVVAPDTSQLGFDRNNDAGFAYFITAAGTVTLSDPIPANGDRAAPTARSSPCLASSRGISSGRIRIR